MIFGILLSIIKGIALLIIGMMPNFPNLGSWVGTSITPLIDVMAAANYFVDLKVVAGCLVSLVAFANIEFVWTGVMWIVRKIPGVN